MTKRDYKTHFRKIKRKTDLDTSYLIIVAFDLIMLTDAYQLFQKYGNLHLSEFKPFGIQFFYNFLLLTPPYTPLMTIMTRMTAFLKLCLLFHCRC